MNCWGTIKRNEALLCIRCFYAILDVVERGARLSHKGTPNVAGFREASNTQVTLFLAVDDESAGRGIMTFCEASHWAGWTSETPALLRLPRGVFRHSIIHSVAAQT